MYLVVVLGHIVHKVVVAFSPFWWYLSDPQLGVLHAEAPPPGSLTFGLMTVSTLLLSCVLSESVSAYISAHAKGGKIIIFCLTWSTLQTSP